MKLHKGKMVKMKTNKSIDGIACILAVAAIASASALAEDFTVPAGSPTTLTASQAATIYDNVNVNDDLTIDGTYCAGLTNSSSVIRYSLESAIIRPMECFGTVSTSAAIPAFQPRPMLLEQAVRKKGITEGIQIRRRV